MANVLVSGGAGFIGSHLCQSLVEKGHTVICVDNLLTGSKRNIEGLMDNKKFEFVELDITGEITKLRSYEINYLYHLASPASPVQYQKYPLETLRVNAAGTERMLELAKEYGAKFLFTSTSEVYGDPKEHPQRESYWGNVNSFGPRSCYDEAKRFGEALTYTFLNLHDVDARIVRIFNTFGPNMEQDDGRVISTFVMQAISDKPITVHGDGTQTRSFCYVSDMVAGIISAMESAETRGQVINLGNPDERTVMDIAQLIKKMGQSQSDIIHSERPVDDPARRQPDITKAKKLLGWEPKITLEDGLKFTISYFRETLNSIRQMAD